MSRLREDQPAQVTIGFAAPQDGGASVALATLRGDGSRPESLVRVGFRCRPLLALHGRDVAYIAVEAVAAELLRRGLRNASFSVANAELVADLAGRRPVPATLTMPYVRLRCTLNRFAAVSVQAGDERSIRDLTARARAELCLTVAA